MWNIDLNSLEVNCEDILQLFVSVYNDFQRYLMSLESKVRII